MNEKKKTCPHTWFPRNRIIRVSKNLIMLSHWLPGNCWGALPGDLDDFPAWTRAALGALQIVWRAHDQR